MYYILDDNNVPVSCDNDRNLWGKKFINQRQILENSFVKTDSNGHEYLVKVSTVFLGLASTYDYMGKPQVFETMIFYSGGGEYLDDFQTKYTSYEAAVSNHKSLFAKLSGLEVFDTLGSI